MVSSILILPILTLIIILFLALVVFFADPNKETNRVFSLFALWAGFWVFSVFMADFSKNLDSVLFWSKISILGPAVFSPILVYLSYIFPIEKNKPRNWQIFLLFLPTFTFISSWFMDINIKKVWFEPWGSNFTPGSLYYLLVFFIFSYFVLSFKNFYKSYKFLFGKEKKQIRFVFFGFFTGVIIGLTTNAILPIFGYAQLSSVGPAFSVMSLAGFIAYSITANQLFNIKVILTQVFVLIVSLILLFQIIIAPSTGIITLNIGIFISFCLFGYYLVKSVIKEVKLREQAENLAKQEKELKEKAESLVHEFERLDTAKNQFIMATQHHLRTPLTSMIGYIDLLLSGSFGKIPLKIKGVLLKFQASTSRLGRTISEFLDISQFQLGKEVVSLEPNVDITPILEEMEQEISFEAKNKGIYFKVEKSNIPLIVADSNKLKIAFFNIADNAIKYTIKGGVSVSSKVLDNKLQIIFKDTGMGLTQEDKESLFTKLFERGAQAQKAFATGRGIGLYLSYQIIKAHGGKLWADSEGRNKGSIFYIDLPIK